MTPLHVSSATSPRRGGEGAFDDFGGTMKLALAILVAALLMSCAHSANRARETTNIYRTELNKYAEDVTRLGEALGIYCTYKVRIGTPEERESTRRVCNRAADLYDGIRATFRVARASIDVYEVALLASAKGTDDKTDMMRVILKIRQLANELRGVVSKLKEEVDALQANPSG